MESTGAVPAGRAVSEVRPSDVSVFIDPFTHHFLRNELFNPENRHNVQGAHEPYFHLRDVFRSNGIDVNTADYLMSGEKTNRVNVYFSLGMLDKYRALARRSDVVLSGFFTVDAPIIQPSVFRSLRTLNRYFKRLYSYTTPDAVARYGCHGLPLHKYHIPYPYAQVIDNLWSRTDRKFLTLLNYNRMARHRWHELYSERLRALEYFSRYDEIDMYGLAWEKAPYLVGETWIPATVTRLHRWYLEHFPGVKRHGRFQAAVDKSWRGAAKNKYEAQSGYTFTICYENMELPGWLNENIFDCFLVGTIPVFLGPPDITDYVPAECFIDKRQFPNYEELRTFLKSRTPRDVQRYKDAARAYLDSDQYRPFRKESFVDIFVRAVEEDVGVHLHPAA
jgi:alpha(1,3/1,4) fucosyltransferase